jgi:hypothetical protein
MDVRPDHPSLTLVQSMAAVRLIPIKAYSAGTCIADVIDAEFVAAQVLRCFLESLCVCMCVCVYCIQSLLTVYAC